MLWSPPELPPGRFSLSAAPRHSLPSQRFYHLHRFPRIASSGCFFNGASQVCFFEPFLPLLYGGFGFFDYGYGFYDGWPDQGYDLGLAQSEISAMAQAGNTSEINPPQEEEETEAGNSAARGDTTVVPEQDRGLGAGVFLLVLNNGSVLRAADYWTAEGYLEYVSPDGTRSHIPLDALDLDRTVGRNAPRGLSFVLRSTPSE